MEYRPLHALSGPSRLQRAVEGMSLEQFDIKFYRSWIGWLALACLALAGCAPKTGVSVTGDAPAQFSHVYLTTKEIWFNSNASAAPDDTAWIKFPLGAPVTIDLLTATNGALTQIANRLSVPAGTYAQVRLIPLDSTEGLASSAQGMGISFNSEVDYLDSANVTHKSPLELQNPAAGIGIATTLTITTSLSGNIAPNTNTTMPGTTGGLFSNPTTTPSSTTGGLFSTPATNTTTGGLGSSPTPTTTLTGNTPGGLFSTPANAPTGTPPRGLFSTPTNTTGSTAPTPVSVAISLDGSRDLVPFQYSGQNAVLLNPHMRAFGSSTVGAVQGSLSLAGLSGLTNASGRVEIQVTAEALSADGTRHVAVNSAFVNTDGNFVIYPLSTGSNSSAASTYDLVIHGPGIATIIVKAVPVTVGDPTTTTPVSIGTVVPRAATSYSVNLQTATPLQAGALVGFYQTLPGVGEVPYLIEERPIDPFNRDFAAPQSISAATLDAGIFVSGTNVGLTATAPAEGAGTYRVAATAPMFNAGPLTTTVSAPATSSTRPVLVAVPALSMASGATSSSISLAISEATPHKYDKGELIISHDGAIVATSPLDTLLAQGGTGTLAVSGLPGGSSAASLDSGIYFVGVRAWNSSNPAGTLHRQAYSTPADLRNGDVTGFAVSID